MTEKAKQRAARGPVLRLEQSKEVRQRDYDQRMHEQASAVQAVRTREIGASKLPKAAGGFESVEAFKARGGNVQRLGNGVVSKHSQFQRLQVTA